MILDINLPQRGCFVGLVQRFGVFKLNNLGFTLFLTLTKKHGVNQQKPRYQTNQGYFGNCSHSYKKRKHWCAH